MSDCSSDWSQDADFVVRRPIFNRDKTIWGYELLANEVPTLPDGGEVISLGDLISAYQANFSRMQPDDVHDAHLFLTIPDGVHLTESNLPDGWDNCVFELCKAQTEAPGCKDFIKNFSKTGGCMAIDENVDAENARDLQDETSIVKVSLSERTPLEVVKIRQLHKGLDRDLMATDVSDWEAFEGTKALGFQLFQGAFFASPNVSSDEELPINAKAKLELLQKLNDPNCEVDELAVAIGSDVSLSFRFLKYINSASFGLRNNIASIQQAVALLGLVEVRHWAMVVLMSDMDPTPKGDELTFMALQRARFLSQLADSIENFPHSSDSMFLLGLFSLLDALLAFPMEQALQDMPLDPEMKAALCGDDNGLRDWILFLEAVEDGSWEAAHKILGQYGASYSKAATEYMKAAAWASCQIPELKK